MTAVDSRVLIDALRDKSGKARKKLEARLGEAELSITPFTRFEIMKGCRDARPWDRLARNMSAHCMFPVSDRTWEEAARIVFDAKKKGVTIRSTIDCLIAQVVMEHDRLLLHKDRDFEAIATIRPLKQEWIDVLA